MLRQISLHSHVYTAIRAVKGLSSLPWGSLVLLQVLFPRWGLFLGLLSSRDLGWPAVALGQKDKGTVPSRRNGA